MQWLWSNQLIKHKHIMRSKEKTNTLKEFKVNKLFSFWIISVVLNNIYKKLINVAIEV